MLKSLTRTGIAAAACAAAAAALLTPAAASAQAQTYQGYAQNYGSSAYARPYDYNDRYQSSYDDRYDTSRGYYDACERRRDNQVAGGVVGATIGAIAGSQIAARGHRTDGSILGGVLGAAVGASAGRNANGAAACDNRYDRSDYRYSDSYSDRGSDDRYRDDRYRDERYDGGYDDRDRSSYDSSGYRTDGDGCRVAESQVRLPDGRYETRYVRACPDQYGRYRVVD